jgi:Co/Zn/Cd efflux system component
MPRLKRLEILAAVVSASILLAAAVFWIEQAREVRATLEKAYGSE